MMASISFMRSVILTASLLVSISLMQEQLEKRCDDLCEQIIYSGLITRTTLESMVLRKLVARIFTRLVTIWKFVGCWANKCSERTCWRQGHSTSNSKTASPSCCSSRWPATCLASSSTCGLRSGYLSFLAASSSPTRFTLHVGQCSTQCRSSPSSLVCSSGWRTGGPHPPNAASTLRQPSVRSRILYGLIFRLSTRRVTICKI